MSCGQEETPWACQEGILGPSAQVPEVPPESTRASILLMIAVSAIRDGVAATATWHRLPSSVSGDASCCLRDPDVPNALLSRPRPGLPVLSAIRVSGFAPLRPWGQLPACAPAGPGTYAANSWATQAPSSRCAGSPAVLLRDREDRRVSNAVNPQSRKRNLTSAAMLQWMPIKTPVQVRGVHCKAKGIPSRIVPREWIGSGSGTAMVHSPRCNNVTRTTSNSM